MCTHDTVLEEARSRREKGLTRRDFHWLALSAAAIAILPGTTVADDVVTSMVDVVTPDGVADGYFAHPAHGKYPAVLLWPDYFGLRPAYQQMAKRLASSGYSVLVINAYYRGAKSPVAEKVDFEQPGLMEKLSTLARALDDRTVAIDSAAMIAFLDSHPAVDTARGIGVMGYCMGGGFAFRSAATVPERVAAIASFHGGGLASDEPDSPHLLIPRIRAQALIAIAENDDAREPQAKTTLREAFDRAGLSAEIEVYAGAKHGWCTPDMTAYYHPAQARRAWARLLALFERALA